MSVINIEAIKSTMEAAVPGTHIELIQNPSPSGQHSLLLPAEHAVALTTFLRDDADLCFDFCSNATGVDWPDLELTEKVKVKTIVDGVEKEIEEIRKTTRPGYLEAVYHLFSMEKKHGPLVIRMRTADRAANVTLPSFTPIWRSAEFQEREIFDLYGIHFTGHPDLRRLLMWDDFKDHPMRKDYVEPEEDDGTVALTAADIAAAPAEGGLPA
jgi:NADH-quinone oxidoreductase subunit C